MAREKIAQIVWQRVKLALSHITHNFGGKTFALAARSAAVWDTLGAKTLATIWTLMFDYLSRQVYVGLWAAKFCLAIAFSFAPRSLASPSFSPPSCSVFFLCGGVLTAHIKDHKTKVFAQLSALQRSTLTPTKRRYNHCIGWKERDGYWAKKETGGLNYKLFAVLETQSAAQIFLLLLFAFPIFVTPPWVCTYVCMCFWLCICVGQTNAKSRRRKRGARRKREVEVGREETEGAMNYENLKRCQHQRNETFLPSYPFYSFTAF